MPFTNKQDGKNAIHIRREQHLISQLCQNISEIFIYFLFHDIFLNISNLYLTEYII